MAAFAAEVASTPSAAFKVAQAARTTLRDVDLASLEVMDDALEVLYYMQRFSYPLKAKLGPQVKQWITANVHHFHKTHFIDICNYALEQKNVAFWNHTILHNQEVANRFADELLSTFTLEELLPVANVFWSTSAANPIFKEAISRQIVKLLPAAYSLELFCTGVTLAQYAPEAARTVVLKRLREEGTQLPTLMTILTATANSPIGSSDFILEVTNMFLQRVDQWTIPIVTQFLALISVPLKRVLPKEAEQPLLTFIGKYSAEAPGEELSKLYDALSLMEIPESITSFVEKQVLQRTKTCTLQEKALFAKALGVAGKHKETNQLLVELVPLISSLSGRALANTLRAAAALSWFPSTLQPAADRALEVRQHLSPDDAAVTVFTLAQAGVQNAQFYQSMCERVTNSWKFARSADQETTTLSPHSTAMLIRGLDIAGYSIEKDSKLVELLSSSAFTSTGGFSLRDSVSLFLVFNNLKLEKTEAARNVGASIRQGIETANISDLMFLANACASMNFREVSLFDALCDRLMKLKSQLAIEDLVVLVRALQKVQLTQMFAKSELDLLIPSLQHKANSEQLAVLAAHSSDRIKQALAQVLEKESLQSLPVEALLFLLGEAVDCSGILRELSKREPTTAAVEECRIEKAMSCVLQKPDANRLVSTLVRFINSSIPKLSAQSLFNIFVCCEKLPPALFRALGKRVATVAHTLGLDQAVRILSQYATHQVRDDLVVKALVARLVHFARVQSQVVLSSGQRILLLKCIEFFGEGWGQPLKMFFAAEDMDVQLEKKVNAKRARPKKPPKDF